MPDPIKILVCVLTTHERQGWVCKHLAEWIANLRFNPNYLTHVAFAHNFIPAASARNFFCRTLKDATPKPDWLLMIDNDMAPNDDLLDSVKDAPEDASIVVPRFMMWDEGKPRATLCWGMDRSPQQDSTTFDVIPGKFYELTKCGTGAIFIKPEVFSKIEMPYFWYTYNSDMGMDGTEDINFCKKVRDAGLKIYGNGSVDVGHYHNVNLSILAKLICDTRDKKELDKSESLGSVAIDESKSPSDLSVVAACPA